MDCTAGKGNDGCVGGNSKIALDYIKSNGIVAESSYPYQASVGACQQDSGPYKISGRIAYSGCNSIRNAVRQKPVSVALAASGWSGYESGIFSCPVNPQVNHVVLLVGYTSLRHWIIKNSWGPTWGEQGYMTISQDRNCNICQFTGSHAIV